MAGEDCTARWPRGRWLPRPSGTCSRPGPSGSAAWPYRRRWPRPARRPDRRARRSTSRSMSLSAKVAARMRPASATAWSSSKQTVIASGLWDDRTEQVPSWLGARSSCQRHSPSSAGTCSPFRRPTSGRSADPGLGWQQFVAQRRMRGRQWPWRRQVSPAGRTALAAVVASSGSRLKRIAEIGADRLFVPAVKNLPAGSW